MKRAKFLLYYKTVKHFPDGSSTILARHGVAKFRFIHVKLEVWNENQKPDLAFGRFAKFGPLENPSWDPWGPNLEVGSPFFGTLVEALR